MHARLELVEPVGASTSRTIAAPGDDHRRPLRLEAGHAPALGERQRGEPRELGSTASVA